MPNQILTEHVNCPECIANKSISTKLQESKSVTDPNLKSEYQLYRSAVWRFSNRTYREHMFEQTRDRQNHLDHILSIVDGFKNNVDPIVMGSLHNIRIITGAANRKKSYKSDITVEKLMEKYNA